MDFSPSQTQPKTVAKQVASKHKLELDFEKLTMTGVTDVPTFTDKEVTVRLSNETVLLSGQNLSLKNLDLESGKLQISGRIYSIKYTAEQTPTSFFKRLFK